MEGVCGVRKPPGLRGCRQISNIQLLPANLGLPFVSKKHKYSCLFADTVTTSIVIAMPQQMTLQSVHSHKKTQSTGCFKVRALGEDILCCIVEVFHCYL